MNVIFPSFLGLTHDAVTVPPEREVFKRRRSEVNYKEEDDLDDDDYICEYRRQDRTQYRVSRN